MRFRSLFLAIVFVASAARAEVPLLPDATGHFTVPVFVNGKGPFLFILDNGADETGVYAWFAKSLGLPQGTSRELSGATGSAAMTGTRIATLAVDGRVITEVDADTIPDRADGRKIAGVVGVDVMADRLAVMDFGHRTFSLLPLGKTGPEVVGAKAVLVQAGAIPGGKQFTLGATLNGVAGTAVLDSGARGTIINFAFARAAGLKTESAPFRDGAPARGALAASTVLVSRVGPIGTVRFAGITRAGVVAKVEDLPYWESTGLAKSPAMNLGVDLLQGTRLTIDYSGRRFWIGESGR